MFDTLLKLTKCRNGWMVRAMDSEGEPLVKEELEFEDNHEVFADFLRIINENFGPTDGKYSQKRVRVFCIPGMDYAGEMDEEYLGKLRELRDDLNYILRRKWKKKKSAGTRTRIT